MPDRFESLESGEVISVKHDTQMLSGHRTFRVGELSEAIESHLKNAIADWNEEHNGWLKPQGIDCEALRFGSQGWQKGRIRLCLEFCPDEPNSAVQGTTANSISMASTPPSSGQAISSTVAHNTVTSSESYPSNNTSTPATTAAANAGVNTNSPVPVAPATNLSVDAIANNSNPLQAAAIPAVGIAAVGAVAAATIKPSDLHPSDTQQVIPHFAETTLEQEEHPSESNIQHSIDEIAYDFSHASDDRGVATPNGMMELDLADLGLGFSDGDLLSFETSSMNDSTGEFLNLHDTSRSENSGMLIDEVWNEMNQGNWPGIN